MVDTKYTHNGTDYTLSVKPSISLVEEGALVDLVVSSVIDQEDDTWTYAPCFYNYALYANLLRFFTGFDFENDNNDLNHVYMLINESNIIEVLHQSISGIQLLSISTAINNQLEFQKQMQLKKVASPFGEIYRDLKPMFEKWDKRLSRAFKPKVVEKVMHGLSQLDINGKTLPDAVVEMYKAVTSEHVEQ